MDDLVAVRAVAGRPDRADVDHRPLGADLRALALGEPQVVLLEGVLGSDRAADHAAADELTARARRAVAAEERVVSGHTGLAEVHAHARLGVGLLDPDLPAELVQQLVGGIVHVDVDDAEHALGLVVVAPQLGLPVLGQMPPLGVGVEGLAGAVERVGVPERTATDAAAADHRDVLEGREPEDALEAQPRHPPVAARVPGVLGELVVGEPPTALQDADAVPFLAQPQRGDAAAEARADDRPVEVKAV